MKTHVITVSKNFLIGHIREGEPTGFKDKILNGKKIHTIRNNVNHWLKVINDVNSGKFILSVREWSGKPYSSKQNEICQYTKLGYQFINIDDNGKFHIPKNKKGKNKTTLLTIANNDGLSQEDFEAWFGLDKIRKTKHTIGFTGIIIHFTDLIYT